MDENELKELLKRFYETRDTAVRETIIERNLRLVYHIIKKFQDGALSVDDLSGTGSVGLIKAVDTFNPDRNTRFATYAARCIENEILMELRRWNKSKNISSLQDPIGTDREGNELYLDDTVSDDFDTEEEAIKKEQRVVISRESMREAGLKDRDIRVLYLRYVTGKIRTQREIAERLGISRSYVSRIEQKAIKKLRKKYEALI